MSHDICKARTLIEGSGLVVSGVGSPWWGRGSARGQALTRARELAHQIAALPQPAIRGDKEALIKGANRELQEGLRIEAEIYNRLIGGAEMGEGLRQFNERDHPDRVAGEARTSGIARARMAKGE